MSGPSALSAEFLELVDAYCSGSIDDDGVSRLEKALLESASARRYFVEYFHHHTEIQFAVRAGHAAAAVLDRLSGSAAGPRGPRARVRAWLVRPRARWLAGVAVGVALASLTFAVFRVSGLIAPVRAIREGDVSLPINVAWLKNAQDCRWSGNDEPGRDMQKGKVLRLNRGLAEIEFDEGARVILQAPAGLELVSARTTRLLYGTLTVRVPLQARGFTVLSPSGKIVDLGTEFGLSVSEGGATNVRVFTGLVEAFPLGAVGNGESGVTIHQDQTAQIERGTVAVDRAGPRKTMWLTSGLSCRHRFEPHAWRSLISNARHPVRSWMARAAAWDSRTGCPAPALLYPSAIPTYA